MPIQAANPFAAFIAGRQARQSEEYGNTRNALARQDLETGELRNRMAQEQHSQEQVQRALQQTAATASRLAQSPNVRAELQQYPEFVGGLRRQLPEFDQMQDEELREYLGFVAGQAQSRLGIGPAAPAGPMSAQGKIGADVRGGYLTPEQAEAAMNPGMTPYQKERLEIERQKLNQPQGAYRPLTPAEVQQAGLPAGTSAQIGPDGKIDVLSKRDNTGVLSQKDATTAKNKLTMIKVARQQLARIKAAYEKGISGEGGITNAFGPGQGYIATRQGKSFDAAVDQMRSTLTALTRTPGVGAMSDYETKLDQSKFPKRTEYETVTAEKIQGIDDLLGAIEQGYTGLLSGGAGQAEQPQTPSAPQQPTGISPEGYDSLPSGTQYRAPDGSIRVKR
jgi:hypothetical protein